MAWNFLKFKAVVQDYKLNLSFMSAHYLIAHLNPQELNRK